MVHPAGEVQDRNPVPAKKRPGPIAAFGYIPAVAAAGVVTLYTVGALTEVARLHGAGVSVSDFLVLIPLPDLLASGVSTLTQGFFLILFVFILPLGFLIAFVAAVAAQVESRRSGTAPPIEEAEPKRQGRTSRLMARWYVAAIIATFFVALTAYEQDPVYLLFPLVSYLYLYTVDSLHPSVGRWYLTAVGFFLLVFVQVLSFYVYPNRLPTVALTLNNGTAITGGYITKSNGDWYVARAGKTVVAVPEARVSEAIMKHTPNPKPRTTYQIVRSWFR